MINLQSFKYLLTEHIEGAGVVDIQLEDGGGALWEQASVNKKRSVASADFPANQI